jgi:hypothetical protein
MSIIPIAPSRTEQLYRLAIAGIAVLMVLSLGLL